MTAIREQTVGLWVTWALVLVTLVAAFVVEFRRERARRRRDGTPLN